MVGDDLFTWIDSLWTKKQLEGTPPTFMMHRFLAADKDLAIAARYLQVDLRRDARLLVHVWKGLLPKGRGAPRLAYVAPKKPPEAEELTKRMMKVLGERREVVEEMQAVVEQVGRTRELYEHFGIEPPESVAKAATNNKQEESTKGGLRDLL